jgi:hypothetical protein
MSRKDQVKSGIVQAARGRSPSPSPSSSSRLQMVREPLSDEFGQGEGGTSVVDAGKVR